MSEAIDPRARFEELVAEALDDLPDLFARALENVEVVIEEGSPRQSLLGLYQGIPQTERGGGYTWVLPDVITIYRRPIQSRAGSDDELKQMVKQTVIHEIAHHFCISDDRLRELDAY